MEHLIPVGALAGALAGAWLLLRHWTGRWPIKMSTVNPPASPSPELDTRGHVLSTHTAMLLLPPRLHHAEQLLMSRLSSWVWLRSETCRFRPLVLVGVETCQVAGMAEGCQHAEQL
ncbi:hypothetical protein CesoFtcFv8_014456 [Champsocephalus esox]|uniref:Uncharacterized protein n=2 Tax=Champsocephalus TaxID=52236 RepID=A0AAN8DBB7_CHAGU|nr:hypothetical protein CesoFtcFv8_014456 [Champsocephalus esox]KAK5918944.1 hypothetical protein CgunFtcFv8_022882 [Champsocephalus gunnari]